MSVERVSVLRGLARNPRGAAAAHSGGTLPARLHASAGSVADSMGNAHSAKELQVAPVGDGTLTQGLGRCTALSSVSTEPMQLFVEPTDGTSTSSTVSDERGTLLYTTKFDSSVGKATITVTDASGAVLAVGLGKDQLSKAKFQVLRPKPAFKGQPPSELADLVHRKGLDVQLYPFGTGEIKTWLTTAKATYKTTKGDDEGQPIHVPLCARDP